MPLWIHPYVTMSMVPKSIICKNTKAKEFLQTQPLYRQSQFHLPLPLIFRNFGVYTLQLCNKLYTYIYILKI